MTLDGDPRHSTFVMFGQHAPALHCTAMQSCPESARTTNFLEVAGKVALHAGLAREGSAGASPAFDALREGVDDCGCDGGSISGRGASAQLVQSDQAGTRGPVQRRGCLRQLHQKGALRKACATQVRLDALTLRRV